MRCWYDSDTNDAEEPTLDLCPHLEMKPKMDSAWVAKNLSWIG